MATILITGCTRGLGHALTCWLAEQGHTVAGCGRDAGRVVELHHELGAPHHFASLDVADDAAVAAWCRDVLIDVGTPSIIINNAATINEPAPLWEISAHEFDQVIDINIKGVANVIRHFTPSLIARGSGVIVNMSSGWGRGASPDVAPYCATKFAIEGLTRALAQELPRGLCTVALNPGIIDTDMLRLVWEDEAGAYHSPKEWVLRAGPMIMALGPQDNGKSLSVK